MDDFESFVLWEAKSRDTIDFKKIYVDMAHDLVAGLLLSQIVYWYLPDHQGKNKLRVQKDGHYWIAKAREDWWDEIRITSKQFDRASSILVKKGILIKDYFMFDGFRMTHIRLDYDKFIVLWNKQIGEQRVRPVLTKGEDRGLPKVKTGVDERLRPITETTTKNTTEIMPQSGESDFSDLFGETPSPPEKSRHNGHQPLTEEDAARLVTFGLMPGEQPDPEIYAVKQELQAAGWHIQEPDILLAVAYFILALRESYPDFRIPNDAGTRKDWYQSVAAHLKNYSLDELSSLYKRAIMKMRDKDLSAWRPGALTKWTLPEVANEKKVAGLAATLTPEQLATYKALRAADQFPIK